MHNGCMELLSEQVREAEPPPLDGVGGLLCLFSFVSSLLPASLRLRRGSSSSAFLSLLCAMPRSARTCTLVAVIQLIMTCMGTRPCVGAAGLPLPPLLLARDLALRSSTARRREPRQASVRLEALLLPLSCALCVRKSFSRE